MADRLSRSEVESLLSALDAGQSGRKATGKSASASFSSLASTESKSSSEQARAAVQFVEPFRLRFEQVLTEMLGEAVRLKRHMPMRVTLNELSAQRVSAEHLFVLEAEQAGADLLLLAEVPLLKSLVIALLGQNSTESEPELTLAANSFEVRLLERLCRESATGVHPSDRWKLEEIDSTLDPKSLVARTRPADWWLETWELKATDFRGIVRFAAPWEFISGEASVDLRVSESSEDR